MGYQAKPSKGLCKSDAPANADGACASEKDCGGAKGVGGFCLLQAKFRRITGIFANNQFGIAQVDTTNEHELGVPSAVSRADRGLPAPAAKYSRYPPVRSKGSN